MGFCHRKAHGFRVNLLRDAYVEVEKGVGVKATEYDDTGYGRSARTNHALRMAILKYLSENPNTDNAQLSDVLNIEENKIANAITYLTGNGQRYLWMDDADKLRQDIVALQERSKAPEATEDSKKDIQREIRSKREKIKSLLQKGPWKVNWPLKCEADKILAKK